MNTEIRIVERKTGKELTADEWTEDLYISIETGEVYAFCDWVEEGTYMCPQGDKYFVRLVIEPESKWWICKGGDG